MKKCKQGYYYCYKDKKCKRIPGGYRVGLGGYLRREREEERSEDSGETETKKNGNGNGNGNGGNGNGGNGGGNGGGGVSEAVMSPAQKRKDTMLKKKYDKSDMKQNMIDQYGKEEGTKIYFATIRKQAMNEGWSDKYKKSIDCDNPKGFSQKAHCQGKKKMNEQTCPVCGFDPCQCLEGVITEKRDGKSSKDKGYSLRDWFKGGGWKQTGGKYDGKPCAKQPGQKTKPYCRDADDRAAMSKEERNKRAAKKRKEDPNPNRKGKARNVTQESYSNWRKDLEQLDEFLGTGRVVAGRSQPGVNPAGGSRYTEAGTVQKLFGVTIPGSFKRGVSQSDVDRHNKLAPSSAKIKPDNVSIDQLMGSKPGGQRTVGITPVPKPQTSTPTPTPTSSQSSSGAITSANNTRLRQTQQDGRDIGRMTGTSDLMNKTTNTSNRTQSYYDMLRKTMRDAGMPGADQNMNLRGVPMSNSYEPEGEVVEGYDDGDVIRPYDRTKRLDGSTRSHNDDKRDKKVNPTVPLRKAHYEPQGELVNEMTPGGRAREAVNYQRGGYHGDADFFKQHQDAIKDNLLRLSPYGPGGFPKARAKAKPKTKPTTQMAGYEPEGELVDEGKKDACYHKVKSRYSVWPSAYASGALVKCRKVGAKNWGNKSKKNESVDYSNWRDDFIPTEYETTDLIKADPIQVPPSNLQKIEEAKKCWKGYKKTGTQKLFGKTYNRCEKIKKEHYDWRAEINIQEAIPGYEKYNAAVKAANKLTGRDKINALKAAAALRPKTEKEVSQKLGEDWQKSNRKDGVDGMSQKSVDAYKRENPGSNLKTAVTGKVKKGSKDAKRRKSFCSRSKGQKDMHNIDCTKTPDKKICKARKRWKC